MVQKAERDVKTGIYERSELLGLAAKSVKDPRLLRVALVSDGKQVVECLYTMDEEG